VKESLKVNEIQMLIDQSMKKFLGWPNLSNMQLPQGPPVKQLTYMTRPGYESRNRCSFSRFLKVSSDDAEVTLTGMSFHARSLVTRCKWHRHV